MTTSKPKKLVVEIDLTKLGKRGLNIVLGAIASEVCRLEGAKLPALRKIVDFKGVVIGTIKAR